MMIPSIQRAAFPVVMLGLLSVAATASAQENETGPRVTPMAGVAIADDTLAAPAIPALADTIATAGPLGAEVRAPLGAEVAPVRRSFLPVARMDATARSPVDVLGTAWGLVGEEFREEQLTHGRVVDAQLEAKFDLKALFAERGLSYPPRDIYFRLFKQEQVLEVWVREAPGTAGYTLLREYDICAIPGRLGPKTRVDDYQAPEGFYYIQGFNPESEFHLSLRLNYPNAADRIIGVADAWGGDIYIHGGCSTVGCFPMTDEAMRELYWLAVEARTAGQTTIPVHVFPARMTADAMDWLRGLFGNDEQLLAFWENLREGYAWFEEHRTLPFISVDAHGRYLFAAEPPIERGLIEDDDVLGAPIDAQLSSRVDDGAGEDAASQVIGLPRPGESPTALLP